MVVPTDGIPRVGTPRTEGRLLAPPRGPLVVPVLS